MDENGGRGVLVHRHLGHEFGFRFVIDEIGRVDEHTEIRSATDLIGGIHGGVSALAIIGHDRGRQMATGGKSKNADALGMDAPRLGMMARQSERALGVLQRRGVFLAIHTAGHAVLHHNRCHTKAVQPFGYLRAF